MPAEAVFSVGWLDVSEDAARPLLQANFQVVSRRVVEDVNRAFGRPCPGPRLTVEAIKPSKLRLGDEV
jgi:hypothetical protein